MTQRIIIFVLTAFFLGLIFQTQNIKADATIDNKTSEVIVPKKLDQRAQILTQYLTTYNSPLQYNAQDFIDAANQFELDWKMIPAIAGVESTFGKEIPGGYNAWGWGVYGNQAIYFTSWREAIFTIARGLRENYLNKGLNNPYSINAVYAASPYWGGRVTYFMNDLERFAQNNGISDNKSQAEVNPKVAAVSGQLALQTVK